MRSLFLSIVLVITSCNSQKKTTFNSSEGVTTKNHRLTLLLQDNYSGSEVEETLIIKDVKTLKVFYSRINRTRKPGIPLPNIDFTKEIVVIHCSGEQNMDSQFEQLVMEETDNEIIVRISSIPTNQRQTSLANVSPFSVYKMPISKKNIKVVKER